MVSFYLKINAIIPNMAQSIPISLGNPMKRFVTITLISLFCIGCSQLKLLPNQELPQQDRYLKVLNGQDPLYLDKSSIRVNSDNSNELSYYLITNISSSDRALKGTSMKKLTTVNCADKTAILSANNQFEVYTQFFAQGEKLFDIPEKHKNRNAKYHSFISHISKSLPICWEKFGEKKMHSSKCRKIKKQ